MGVGIEDEYIPQFTYMWIHIHAPISMLVQFISISKGDIENRSVYWRSKDIAFLISNVWLKNIGGIILYDEPLCFRLQLSSKLS